MALSISSKLLPTENPIYFFPNFFLLINKVKSDFSFNFPTFGPDAVDVIVFANDAALSNGAIQLTKRDGNGDPQQHSTGQSGLINPIIIYDKNSGKVADFSTEFTFIVNKTGRRGDYGDGMAFFCVSPDFKLPSPQESDGGFLGMFTPKTAFNFKQQLLLVEFDTFANEWDPPPKADYLSAHTGIDVSSIKSVVTEIWAHIDLRPDARLSTARISYDSQAKKLNVSVTYPPGGKGPLPSHLDLTHDIDLTTLLPEKVQIGFSAATGDLVETHDVLSWSFTSNL